MKNILVTGSNGQVGSELQSLASQYPHFHFVFTGSKELNIGNRQAIEQTFELYKPDFCINCAAYTAVDKAETEVEKARLINATGVAYLAKVCNQYGATLVHISSDYVYHNQINRPLLETDSTSPKGIYAKTKLEGDQLALAANQDVIILRTSWVFSSFGHNFLKTMIRLGEERDTLSVVYDQIGVPTYARDIANAILAIIQKIDEGKEGVGGIYNFAPSGVTCWYDFARAIFEIESIDCQVNPIPTSAYPLPAPRPHYSILNCAKIRKTFGIPIPYWRDSVRDCLTLLKTPSMM